MSAAPRITDLSDLTLIGLARAAEKELQRRTRERDRSVPMTPAAELANANNAHEDTVLFLAAHGDQEEAYRAAVALEKREAQVRAGTRRKAGNHGLRRA